MRTERLDWIQRRCVRLTYLNGSGEEATLDFQDAHPDDFPWDERIDAARHPTSPEEQP